MFTTRTPPNLSEIFSDSFLDGHDYMPNSLGKKEVDLLFKHNLFKCFLPKEWNGLGLSLTETVELIEQAAFINGSLGWLIQIGNGGNYFAAYFEEKIAFSYFSNRDTVIAGSGTPTCQAISTDGGYIISGKWRFCSGSNYANWFTITFKTSDNETVLSAMVPRESVTIEEDWDTLGLRQTATNTIAVNQLFVPMDAVFSLSNQRFSFDNPIWNMPFVLFAQAFFMPVVIGIFKRMLAETRILLKEQTHKTWSTDNYKKLNLWVEEGNLLIEKTNVELGEMLEKCTNTADEFTDCTTSAYQLSFLHANENIRNLAHKLFAKLGMEVLFVQHPIARCYMDLMMASQHKLLQEST